MLELRESPSTEEAPVLRAPSNEEIAGVLERVADLLEHQEVNPFRVRAYREAAIQVRALREPLGKLHERGGRKGLQRIPGVGRSLSAVLAELVETGRLGLLDHLESEVCPEALFKRLPGIGDELAARIRDELGLTTLEELEQASWDGRLATVAGIGDKKIRGIRLALSGMLDRGVRRRARQRARRGPRPSVELLLEVDEEYRRRAREGRLRRIAPRRFNPAREAWLPVMETRRGGWELTALYSNTRLAHELSRTHDWVVLYYDRNGDHGQATVVTNRTGPLRDLRVVRGRELECGHHYRALWAERS